ncbi:MAG: COG3014 family protein [Bacteroidota bacterium]
MFPAWDFNSEFEKGDLRKALETLQHKDNLANGRARFIYYANNGLLLSVLGKYEESNEYFEKAFLFGEEYHVNYVYEAASYFTNPNVTVYRGEDHEHLMVLYFKAINYLKMNKPEQALVECRRLNIRLNQLSDKYASENKYQRDAFVHVLMGIIYQSTKDYNNAFIAYRNAVEVYEDDYTRMFDMQVPGQLKKDLLNTAWWIGFHEEFELFKTKFEMPDYQAPLPGSELVFFWHNGLCPVKSEWSINFAIDRRDQNTFVFTNQNLGIAFPFHVEEKDRGDLSKIEVFRVAFPRYLERPQYFQSAMLEVDSSQYMLERAEDINKIAFHSLRERMMMEFSKGLLRVALKKATEYSVKKENDGLGALIGVMNAITEKADTRNWQTLPHTIHYARVPMKEGKNEVKFTINADQEHADYNFTYQAAQNQTLFHTFSSLETSYGPARPY